MIPKIIHYVWMGKSNKPPLIEKCINSWRYHLPNYKFIEWNEDNFDILSNKYVAEAYQEKKWAFVSDYIRLYALFNYGGVYMDTDVEVLKSLDPLLRLSAFTGFERNSSPITGIIGAVRSHPWIGELIEYYSDRSFKNEDGSLDTTTNVTIITNITINKYQIKLDGCYHRLPDDIHIFPSEWFCPLDFATNQLNITKNTYTIHHFNGSWLNSRQRFKKKIRALLPSKLLQIYYNRNSQ